MTYDYRTNGGSSTTKSTEAVSYGAKVDLTPTATKTGYVFVGWNTNKDATKGLDSLTMGTSNITLYAIYSKTIVATFKYYDGNEKTTTLSEVAYNNQVSVQITVPNIANVTLDGETYTARGWSTSGVANADISIAANGTVNISSNITYYASYTYEVTLLYNSTEGSGAPSSQTGMAYLNYAGTAIDASFTISTAKPTRTWYIFQNWNTEIDGTGTSYSSGGTIKLSTNDTLYAIWKANPNASIIKDPVDTTVVAGNQSSFSLTASGNGDLSYQWYYNTTGSTSEGTLIAGATNSTYSFTSSTNMSGRYYYCIVTSIVDSSTATATSIPVLLTVQTANYSILNANKTVYYHTLDTAEADSISGGGDSGGGTIKVLNTVTDNSAVNTNKTITIDTNGKTLTRSETIITTGGTLTIEGNGTIYCSSDSVTLNSNGGNLTISSVTIKGLNHSIYTSANTSGKINITSSYIYTTGRSGMGIYGKGSVNITNSWIYTPVKDKNAILVADGSASTLVITESTVGNGSENTSGTNGSGGNAAAISYHSTGDLTINDSDILAGPYAANSLTIYEPITVNLTGSTRMYTTNTSNTATCIYIQTKGTTINFNSTGYFYCTGSYVAETLESYSAIYNVTKGHFVSRNNKYMFKANGSALTNYASNSSAGSRVFYYMDSYNSITNVRISDCY